jgi:protein-L-isoaspartate(D-aspartate) O-methyltransferase
MVKGQLKARGIDDQRLLDAFCCVERHKFVPEKYRDSAYADYPIPIGEGQTISQPYIVAVMTESLSLTGNEKVLEVGTGSGYQTAILAKLAGMVYTIERISSLAKSAEQLFGELGISNIKLKIGDGTLGWPQEAPFDRIIITAATPVVPLPLIEQLKDSGKLVAPLGESSHQILTLVEKESGSCTYKQLCGCMFVPLIGEYGF